LTSTENTGNPPSNYRWESTLVATIGAVIAILTIVTHLTARTNPVDQTSPYSATFPRPLASQASPSYARAVQPVQPVPMIPGEHPPPSRPTRPSRKPSDPLEITIGPSSISGKFKLMTANRTQATPTLDKLTIRLRVVSRAMADLVTPFQSAMLEVHAPGLEPISPAQPFSYPVHAGDTRNEDIAFMVPSGMDLEHAVLRIHYYNELKEIPLTLLPRDSRH
jgi:hypothetical protein